MKDYCLVFSRYLEPDLQNLLYEEFEDSKFSKKFKKLNSSIAQMVSISISVTRPRGYKTFFMLNSAEHEIYPCHIC